MHSSRFNYLKFSRQNDNHIKTFQSDIKSVLPVQSSQSLWAGKVDNTSTRVFICTITYRLLVWNMNGLVIVFIAKFVHILLLEGKT